MKILITGGGGFLGSALAKRLLSLGNEVTILGRRSYPELEKMFYCIQEKQTNNQFHIDRLNLHIL